MSSGDDQPTGIREQLVLLAFGVVARWGLTFAGRALDWGLTKWAQRGAFKRPTDASSSGPEQESPDLSG